MEFAKCGFVVALIACLEIVCTEGRPFWSRNYKPADQLMNTIEANYKRELGEQRSQLATPPNKNIASSAHHSAAATSTTTAAHNDEEDFRPTTPGNSPGVGHKLFAQASHQHAEPPKAVVGGPSSTGGKNFVTRGTKDDYRPTMPGHSPGVGHAFHLQNADQTNA